MKKQDMVLREFVRSLSDEDIRAPGSLAYVGVRLTERRTGDVGDVVEMLQRYPEVDRLLAAAESPWELFDLLDEVHEHVDREWKRRTTFSISN